MSEPLAKRQPLGEECSLSGWLLLGCAVAMLARISSTSYRGLMRPTIISALGIVFVFTSVLLLLVALWLSVLSAIRESIASSL